MITTVPVRRAGGPTTGRWWALLAALTTLFVAWSTPRPAAAHGFNPSLLTLEELPGGRVIVVWKTSEKPAGRGLTPVLPARCVDAGPRTTAEVGYDQVSRRTIDCGAAGLAGATLRVQGFELFGDDVLVRVRLADGREVATVLRPGTPEMTVPMPSDASALRVAAGYVGLGIQHIALGYDHLLFVLGLTLLVGRNPRRLVATITAFTVAHSITLSLATLGAVRLPSPPVEAAIALSIVFLAVELARGDRSGWAARAPWAVAFVFGLLHGFGFAGALREAGLPAGQVGPALLGFNVGVELGQLAFVALLFGARALLTRPSWPWLGGPRSRLGLVYAIGSLAAFWTFERVAAFGW